MDCLAKKRLQFIPKCVLRHSGILPEIRAPPVLNFDFFKIQNKEDLRNGRQLLHNHQQRKNLCFRGSIQRLPPNEAA